MTKRELRAVNREQAIPTDPPASPSPEYRDAEVPCRWRPTSTAAGGRRRGVMFRRATCGRLPRGPPRHRRPPELFRARVPGGICGRRATARSAVDQRGARGAGGRRRRRTEAGGRRRDARARGAPPGRSTACWRTRPSRRRARRTTTGRRRGAGAAGAAASLRPRGAPRVPALRRAVGTPLRSTRSACVNQERPARTGPGLQGDGPAADGDVARGADHPRRGRACRCPPRAARALRGCGRGGPRGAWTAEFWIRRARSSSPGACSRAPRASVPGGGRGAAWTTPCWPPRARRRKSSGAGRAFAQPARAA